MKRLLAWRCESCGYRGKLIRSGGRPVEVDEQDLPLAGAERVSWDKCHSPSLLCLYLEDEEDEEDEDTDEEADIE